MGGGIIPSVFGMRPFFVVTSLCTLFEFAVCRAQFAPAGGSRGGTPPPRPPCIFIIFDVWTNYYFALPASQSAPAGAPPRHTVLTITNQLPHKMRFSKERSAASLCCFISTFLAVKAVFLPSKSTRLASEAMLLIIRLIRR